MTNRDLEAALEIEEEALKSTQEEFESAKQDKKWVEADKLKHKVQVIQGLIEKIKLAQIHISARRKDKDFDAMNGEKMDKIQISLEKEILEATESYKEQLTKFLSDQDTEMEEFQKQVEEDLSKEE